MINPAYLPYEPSRHLRRVRERAWNAANLLNALLHTGLAGGMEAQRLAQETSYVTPANPPDRPTVRG
jgi:hypothetical protein